MATDNPWDVRHDWVLFQSNGYHVAMDVEFNEGFDGFFRGKGHVRAPDGGLTTLILENARVNGDEIAFKIGRGQYTGHFDFEGRLTGTTFDTGAPTSQATWFADKQFHRMIPA